MTLAATGFDVFITVDRNLSYQQNLPRYDIALIVLRSVSNRYQDLAPFGPMVIESLPQVKNGTSLVLDLNK